MVSLIIPTYERYQVLIDLLDRIDQVKFEKIERGELEILIVDQSKINRNSVFAEKDYYYKVHYIHTPIVGLPNARNIGLEQAQGDICIFIDDDVTLTSKFIFEHCHYYSNMEIGAVAGKITEDSKRVSVIGPTPSTMFGYNIWGRAYANRGGDTENEVLGFPGGNFSMRRSLRNEIGLFDIKYAGSSLFEETDYAYRIRKKGYRIIFSPKAVLHHLEIKNGGCRLPNEIEKQYWRFHNAIYFNLKNKTILVLPFILTSFTCIAVLKAYQNKPFIKNFVHLIGGLINGVKTYFTEQA